MAYTDKQKADALIALVGNSLDFMLTAEETGISHMTLRRWWRAADKAEFGLEAMLQDAAIGLLANVPAFNSGRDWAIAVGILVDKLALIRGVTGEGDGNTVNVNVNNGSQVMVEKADLGGLLSEGEELLRQMERARLNAADPVITVERPDEAQAGDSREAGDGQGPGDGEA